MVCRFPQDVFCISYLRGEGSSREESSREGSSRKGRSREESRRDGKTDILYHAIVSHNGSKDARLDYSEIKVVKSRGERKEKRRKEKRKERV